MGMEDIEALLSSGLSGGVAPSLPAGMSPVTLGAIHSVITDSITQGVKWAAFTAGIFVSFGTLSSFLIPAPGPVAKAKLKVPVVTTLAEKTVAQAQIPRRN